MTPATRNIFIRNLRLIAPVGIYDHERTAPQPVVVNIVLTVPRVGADADPADPGALAPPEAAHDPSARGFVCYATLSERVAALATRAHTDLLETLADAILDLCLADTRVLAADVQVEKPDAVEAAEAVGVRVYSGKVGTGFPSKNTME